MQFALAAPWWVLALLLGAIALAAWRMYSGAIVPLTQKRRIGLSALRALTLLLLVGCLLRPVRLLPDTGSDAVVPVLVDVSRSMRLPDADGRTRIQAARDLVQREIRPALQGRFQSETWTFGDSLAQAAAEIPAADAGRSDLSGALRALREHYRNRRIAGVVVISDGGDTGSRDAAAAVDDGALPVYTVGVGIPRVAPDAEVLDVSAGEAALTDSTVDLTVAAISRGGAAPFDLRVLENGRPIDVRTVMPAAADSPVRAVFTVSPSRETATLYTVEIPASTAELVLENNKRSVLVEPPGRKRRILMVEGAPGFEHTFIKRALAADPGIELDSVVRKGRDAQGNATFFVQAAATRAPQLATGFPGDRQTLYQYDALVLANIEADALSGAELDMAADFVAERGGGLLVLGGKSFAQQGFAGTPLEEALPVSLRDRGNGVVPASRGDNIFRVSLSDAGQSHPVMRIGATLEETSGRWNDVPPLAGASLLGAPRPGAQVLALVQTPDGTRPLVAVQRYGQGRSLIFTGEASWRWRMQMASENRTYELFWRQAGRWLAAGAPDRVTLAPPMGFAPGDTGALSVDVRDEAFAVVRDAQVTMRVMLPGGETRDVHTTLSDAGTGRYSSEMRFDQPGVYRMTAEARRGDATLGSAQRWLLVGAADVEMADPRLNEDVLRRVSQASGGRYLSRADEIARLPSLLAAAEKEPPAPRVQELWHNIWIFTGVMMLLAAEWMLRRKWGLR